MIRPCLTQEERGGESGFPAANTKNGTQYKLNANLERLLEQARKHRMSKAEEHAQLISFAYGNVAIENPDITREMVERAVEGLDR